MTTFVSLANYVLLGNLWEQVAYGAFLVSKGRFLQRWEPAVFRHAQIAQQTPSHMQRHRLVKRVPLANGWSQAMLVVFLVPVEHSPQQ